MSVIYSVLHIDASLCFAVVSSSGLRSSRWVCTTTNNELHQFATVTRSSRVIYSVPLSCRIHHGIHKLVLRPVQRMMIAKYHHRIPRSNFEDVRRCKGMLCFNPTKCIFSRESERLNTNSRYIDREVRLVVVGILK